MPASPYALSALQKQIWGGSIPLEIRLAAGDCRTYDESLPYLIHHPRVAYLPFLLPQVHAFFRSSLVDPDLPVQDAWLSFDGVALKWHYPLGLLYDLLSGADPINVDKAAKDEQSISRSAGNASSEPTQLPWRLTIHYTDYPSDQIMPLDPEGRAFLDSFVNAVKEADFIRNGTARTVMSMSKEDSDKLWNAVWNHDLSLFNTINARLLDPPGLAIRNAPMKFYLPTSAHTATESETIPEQGISTGRIRVVQALIPLQLSASKQAQTLGTALNTILPDIFPSRRTPLLAQPVLHGSAVPMSAPVEELSRAAAYADGFVHVVIVMLV